MEKKKIAFATGSRADYGIVRKYLSLLNKDENVDLEIITTGALLDKNFGHQVDLIKNDGFKIAAELEIPLKMDKVSDTIEAMSVALEKSGDFFEKNRYDLLIILGDRYEIFSVAIAAAMQRIPILHLHGGEATFANYDEFIRHSITKMSLFHFASTEEYRKRIIQLGEAPDRVFNLGALGAENCCFIDEANVGDEIKKLPYKEYFVILFHPETLSNINPADQMKNILNAIQKFSEYKFVFIGSNADTSSHLIRNKVKNYVEESNNAYYFENLHPDEYHYLVKNSVCLVGNSSSGIIEAPSLGVFTINIGSRQDGRIRGNSVLDIRCEVDDIEKSISDVIKNKDVIKIDNPYWKDNSAELYYKKTIELLNQKDLDKMILKRFYDLDINGEK